MNIALMVAVEGDFERASDRRLGEDVRAAIEGVEEVGPVGLHALPKFEAGDGARAGVTPGKILQLHHFSACPNGTEGVRKSSPRRRSRERAPEGILIRWADSTLRDGRSKGEIRSGVGG